MRAAPNAFGVGSGFESRPTQFAAPQIKAATAWAGDLQGAALRIIEICLFRLFVMLPGIKR